MENRDKLTKKKRGTYETQEMMRKFQEAALWRLYNLSASYHSEDKIKKLKGELSDLMKSFQPEIILEWCTPERIVSGERERLCCTYDGCGGSDDEPGATYTDRYIEAQYGPFAGYTSMSVSSIKEGIEERREILRRYFQEAKANPTMRKAVIQYKERIRKFLKAHPQE